MRFFVVVIMFLLSGCSTIESYNVFKTEDVMKPNCSLMSPMHYEVFNKRLSGCMDEMLLKPRAVCRKVVVEDYCPLVVADK